MSTATTAELDDAAKGLQAAVTASTPKAPEPTRYKVGRLSKARVETASSNTTTTQPTKDFFVTVEVMVPTERTLTLSAVSMEDALSQARATADVLRVVSLSEAR